MIVNKTLIIKINTEQFNWRIVIYLDSAELFDGEIPGNWEAFGFFMNNMNSILKMKEKYNYQLEVR